MDFYPVCQKCDQFIKDQITSFDGKKYHQACFICVECSAQLDQGKFFKKDDGLHCEKCKIKKYNPDCRMCKLKIVDKFITAANQKFHSECFKCEECSQKFDSQGFFFENEKYICAQCNSRSKNLICSQCNELIIDSQYINSNDKKFHQQCCKCYKCSELLEQDYVVQEDKFYHPHCLVKICIVCFQSVEGTYYEVGKNGDEPCHEKCIDEYEQKTKLSTNKEKCCKCNLQITDDYIAIVSDKKYHKDCLICGKCSTQLSGKKIFEKENVLYCPDCKKEKFDPKCQKCKLNIQSSYTHIQGKEYHPDCVNCNQCKDSLINKKYSLVDGIFTCEKCNLPSKKMEPQIQQKSSFKQAEENKTNDQEETISIRKTVQKNNISQPVDNNPKQIQDQNKQQSQALKEQPVKEQVDQIKLQDKIEVLPQKINNTASIQPQTNKADELDPNRQRFPLSILQQSIPNGVTAQKKEYFLSDEEFLVCFKMTLNEFIQLKDWKKDQLKKQNKLF